MKPTTNNNGRLFAGERPDGMRREIKFRGRGAGGEWFVGNLVARDCEGDTLITDLRDGLMGQPVDPATVGQYTGVTDEYGGDVYEGDIIVAVDDPRTGTTIVNFIVVWDCCGFRAASRLDEDADSVPLCCCKDIRIVGNIHDWDRETEDEE